MKLPYCEKNLARFDFLYKKFYSLVAVLWQYTNSFKLLILCRRKINARSHA